MPKIIIENKNLEIDYNPAISLLINFTIQQIPIGSKCGGRGNCGTCRFKVIAGGEFLLPPNKVEQFRLSESALKNGWRLACQTYAVRDLKIMIPDAKETLEKQSTTSP